MQVLEKALKGRAKTWYDSVIYPFANFDNFKERFLQEFYSVEARIKTGEQWKSRRFRAQDGSLRDYFNEQFRVAKYCAPNMEICSDTMQLMKVGEVEEIQGARKTNRNCKSIRAMLELVKKQQQLQNN